MTKLTIVQTKILKESKTSILIEVTFKDDKGKNWIGEFSQFKALLSH